MGCVASREIEEGEVVVSEEVGLGVGAGGRRGLASLFQGFRDMDLQQQQEYLGLANKYQEHPKIWSKYVGPNLPISQLLKTVPMKLCI